MFILVTGGSGSGKSVYAENRITELSQGQPKYYIATMFPMDKESEYRVKKHRIQRQEKNFITIEKYTNLKSIALPPKTNVLLECMSNLTANELYSETGAGDRTKEEVIEGIQMLLSQTEYVVVVTNEVFSDGKAYDSDTMGYLKVLGEMNCTLGKWADEVIEVVYGIPVWQKGRGTSC